jgi:hypothetical protein
MKTLIRYCVLPALCVFTLIFLLPVYSVAQSNFCTAPTPLNSVGASNCVNLVNQTLQGNTQSAPNVTSGTCGGTPGVDVWYSFVAQSTNPTIALSNIGANLRGSTGGTKLQILSGTCPSGFVSEACASNTAMTLSVNPTTLTINQTYFIRVYTNATTVSTGTPANWGYSICITNPAPANDDCAGATVLTSGTACTPVDGNLAPASNSSVTVNGVNCAATAFDDVWYRFVAQTTNPTITLNNLLGFANPGIQLLDNNCGGTFNSLFCSTTGTLAADFLTPGNTYYVRIYSTTNITGNASFEICVTDPVSAAPFNDNCANAVNLPVGNSCNNVLGTVAGATASAPLTTCSGVPTYDVWYKFTAITTTATVSLSSIGANFNTPRLQMFSGTCGGVLTSIGCTASPLAVTGLTVGTTYYVRAYSTTGAAPNGNANFNICVTTTGAPVRFGNSYVNITKKTTGGVVETGDILEIRMTINHTSGTMSRLRYVDNLPTNTVIANTAPNDSFKVITNEGLTYKKYQINAAGDAASYVASPPAGQFQIRMNLGFGASVPGVPPDNTSTNTTNTTGTMNAGSDRPRGGGGLLFAVSYRVRVTGAPGSSIILNPGRFIYFNGTSDVTLTGTPFEILISTPLTLCSNSIGVNVADEFGGTFGSGTNPNRTTDLTSPISGYTYQNIVNAFNGLNDGRYAIVKNISPRNRTNRNARRQNSCNVPSALAEDDVLNCNNRMHGGHWYVDGDHTGTNNAIGNVPPAAPTSAGYMLMVNADYVASEVYRQNINNLCPNTYYEFSAWVRNICRTCGMDSTGAQFAGTPTAPTQGYVGVYPNLSFALDGLDYYSTGEIDTLGWLKKGFVFRTGISQTSATFSIRNNSQGGGGNDWVMDDIAVATCLPTMSYSPTINPNVCTGNAITIADTISSFFRNYTTYKWQKSTNGGGLWTDISGVTTLPETNYYITTYTVPPGSTTMADSGTLYRVVVATTSANLTNPNCNISDGVTITLSVNNCGIPLKTDLLSFNGKLVGDKGHLSWTTSKEDEPVTFILERSNDGTSFVQIGTVNSHNDYTATVNSYSFIDPVAITGKAYYRLVLAEQSGARKFSRTIQLNRSESENLGLINVINPFNYSLEFDITAKSDAKVEVELVDLFGKVVRKATYTVRAGVNALSMPNTDVLSSGTYILRVRNNEVLINRKVLKKSF